jgi:hypothetical protein
VGSWQGSDGSTSVRDAGPGLAGEPGPVAADAARPWMVPVVVIVYGPVEDSPRRFAIHLLGSKLHARRGRDVDRDAVDLWTRLELMAAAGEITSFGHAELETALSQDPRSAGHL